MRMKHTFSRHRLLFGGIAAALGFSSVAAPAIVEVASAAPVQGPGPIQPETISAPGTYEACTPYFGLTKDNADLLSFDVENVNDAVTPTPVIGTDIVPVLTVTDGSQTIECIPDLGWSDEATWQSDYVNGSGQGWIVDGLLTYPGLGFHLMPVIDGSTTFNLTGGGSILPTSSSLRFETNFTGRTITVSPSSLVHTSGGYIPIIQDLSSAQLADPYFAAVAAAVTATGDAAQAAYLRQMLAAGAQAFCNPITYEPYVPDQSFLPLMATLTALNPSTLPSCNYLILSGQQLYNAEVQRAKVPNGLMTLTITDPNATTTTTTSVPVDPIAPAFTG